MLSLLIVYIDSVLIPVVFFLNIVWIDRSQEILTISVVINV